MLTWGLERSNLALAILNSSLVYIGYFIFRLESETCVPLSKLT
jgi:hypothetical protein